MKLLPALSVSALVALTVLTFNSFASNIEKDVKSGKVDLHCFIGNTEKKIDPELIEYELDGYWKFTNGGASNCRIIK